VVRRLNPVANFDPPDLVPGVVAEAGADVGLLDPPLAERVRFEAVFYRFGLTDLRADVPPSPWLLLR